MSKEIINFKNAFISIYTQENIKSSDINEKNNVNLQSVFQLFDTNNDKEINTQEIENFIKSTDINNDGIITKDEIEVFATNNNISKKALSKFIEQIYNILPKNETIETKKGGTPYNKEIRQGDFDLKFSLTIAKHGNYEKYTAKTNSIYFKGKTIQNSAIYDTKNDIFYPTNGKNNFKIIGFNEFFEKKNSTNPPKPKLIITGKNGQTSTIEIKLPQEIGFSNPDDYYKVIMTELTNTLAELEPNVINDLTNNVKNIEFTHVTDADGALVVYYQNSDRYREVIQLDYPVKELKEILTHEIGHAVDANVKSWGTYKNKQELEAFIQNLSNLSEFKDNDIYALTNIKELYAEYYAYKNGKAPSNNNSNEMFNKLEQSPKKYGWNEIKQILENVSNISDRLTTEYIEEQKAKDEKEANMLKMLRELDNKESISMQNILKTISNNEIYDEIYHQVSSEKISSILEKYPSLKKAWDNCDNAESYGEILRTIRNDSDFKEFFLKAIKKIDNQKKFLELDYNNALNELEKRTTLESLQTIKKDSLSKKIDNFGLDNLIKTEGFQVAISEICKNTKEIPTSIIERCSKEPIDKKLIIKLRNQPAMFYFLAYESGLYQTR